MMTASQTIGGGKTMHEAGAFNARMTELLADLTTGEGARPSVLAGVSLMRAERYYPPTPVLYEPSIVVIAQGRKTGYLGGRIFRYDPHNYLVLSVPLPFECETEATPDCPMLGVSIRVELSTLSELIMEMDGETPRPAPPAPQGIYATPLDQGLGGAVVRLLEHLTSPQAARILGPATMREITYRVLCGEQGGALRGALTMHGHFSQISRALKHIHADYARALDIKTLADEAHMSPSVFHRHFKEITAAPPLQYLKTIRLHKARMLMVREGARAGEAAEQVGYESVSQFSREFKRLFGRGPVEETARVQRMLASPKPAVVRIE